MIIKNDIAWPVKAVYLVVAVRELITFKDPSSCYTLHLAKYAHPKRIYDVREKKPF